VNQQTGKPVDTLKLNLGSSADAVGFPNGRRLTDDVVDTELRVVAGALADPAKFPTLADACKAPGTKCPNDLKVGDGVDANDKTFSSQFPYLVRTESGFDSQIPKPVTPIHDPR
jgi:hypothetical protein